MGLSFSVTASVTLMRICLLAAPFRAQPGPHPGVFINEHCGSVWFGQLNKRLKKPHAPDSLYNGAIYAKQLLIIYSLFMNNTEVIHKRLLG